jgi:flagellar motor switch protein FliG
MPPAKKIQVAQTGEQEYELRVDEMRATLARPQLKALLLQLTEALLSEVDPDDLLVVLKLTEEDAAFQKKVFDNMSAKKAKMCREDLEFRMAEPPPDWEANLAIERVMVTARRLSQNDRLTFGG